MDVRNILVLIIMLISLVSCASITPAPQPKSKESSGIAIYLEFEPPISVFGIKIKPNKVYFVKLNEEESDTSLSKNTLISSNYNQDGYVYLLNASPGRYAAVSATHVAENRQQHTTATFYTYFPENLINATIVNIRPNKITFMGGFLVKESIGLNDADDLQKHYYKLMFPKSDIGGSSDVASLVLSGMFRHHNDISYRAELLESRQNKMENKKYLDHANNIFKKSAWLNFVN